MAPNFHQTGHSLNLLLPRGSKKKVVYDHLSILLYQLETELFVLPSCIAFRGNRTVIGDKALDYLEKDAENICMLFKRKMGTQDTYFVPSIDKEMSPIELSSLICPLFFSLARLATGVATTTSPLSRLCSSGLYEFDPSVDCDSDLNFSGSEVPYVLSIFCLFCSNFSGAIFKFFRNSCL